MLGLIRTLILQFKTGSVGGSSSNITLWKKKNGEKTREMKTGDGYLTGNS